MAHSDFFCGDLFLKMSEDQLRRYFLFLKNTKHYAEGSLRVTLCTGLCEALR